jgi:hypothetical protein
MLFACACVLAAASGISNQDPTPKAPQTETLGGDLNDLIAKMWKESAKQCLAALNLYTGQNGAAPPEDSDKQARAVLSSNNPDVTDTLNAATKTELTMALLTAGPSDPGKFDQADDQIAGLFKHHKVELRNINQKAEMSSGASYGQRALYDLVNLQLGDVLDQIAQAKRSKETSQKDAKEKAEALKTKLDAALSKLSGAHSDVERARNTQGQDQQKLMELQNQLNADSLNLANAAPGFRAGALQAANNAADKVDGAQQKLSDDTIAVRSALDNEKAAEDALAQARNAPPTLADVQKAQKQAADAADDLDKKNSEAQTTLQILQNYRLCYRDKPGVLFELISKHFAKKVDKPSK